MGEKIVQANSRKTDTNTQPQESHSESVEVYRPKRWVPIIFVSALLAVGVVGVWFILWGSRAFTDPAARLTFIMGSIISLCLLLSTLATTCIYWGQRNIMLQQWKAMNENIARTDVIISKMGQQQAAMEWQAGIAEIQTGLIDQQVEAMKGQLEAVREQLTVMKEQGKHIKAQAELTLYTARPIIEINGHFQGLGNILLVLKNVGKSRAIVQLRCKAILDNEVVLDEEVPEFEIGIIGQDDRGQWARSFPIVAETLVDDIMSGRRPLRMELTGTYKWEAGSYPINERRKYNDPVFQFQPRY